MGVANISGNILTDSGTNLSSLVSGSGTTNYLPKFTGASTIGDSIIYANSTSVGIGTSSPGGILHTLKSGTAISGIGDEVFIGQRSNSTDNAAVTIVSNNQAILRYTNTSSSELGAIGYDVVNNVMQFKTNSAERMRITSTGNVGIGTTNPTGAAGLALVLNSGANQGRICLKTSSTGDGSGNGFQIGISGTSAFIEQRENADLTFATNASERMRITSGGNLLVGTSSEYGSRIVAYGASATSSDYTLRLLNSNNNNTFMVRNDKAIFAQGVYDFTTGSGSNVVVFSDGSMQRSTSSLKYKKNVENYTKGLAEVMQMRPVTYNSKNEKETQTFAGLIAEEVHDLGLTEFVQYAEDGSPDALSYSNMVALLTKAIQEQQEIINQLSAKVTALENKI